MRRKGPRLLIAEQDLLDFMRAHGVAIPFEQRCQQANDLADEAGVVRTKDSKNTETASVEAGLRGKFGDCGQRDLTVGRGAGFAFISIPRFLR